MSMRVRTKTHRRLYPHWLKVDSPAKRAKARDENTCVVCGVRDRLLVLDDQGQPHHLLYLHAAHVSYLDPLYEQVEPIEGERLLSLCPRCHRDYDARWKPREEEVEHQQRMHRVLLSRWLPSEFLSKRFLEVV